MKTLGEEEQAEGDEEQPGVDVVESGTQGNSESVDGQEGGESNKKPQKGDSTSTNKRKLDADDSGERDGGPVAAESVPDDATAAEKDVSVVKEDGEGVDEDSADRPRKKSKVKGEE